jgi:hypothetical protein
MRPKRPGPTSTHLGACLSTRLSGLIAQVIPGEPASMVYGWAPCLEIRAWCSEMACHHIAGRGSKSPKSGPVQVVLARI